MRGLPRQGQGLLSHRARTVSTEHRHGRRREAILVREPEVAWNCPHAVEAESRAGLRDREIRDSHPPRHFKYPKRNSTKEDIIRSGCSLSLKKHRGLATTSRQAPPQAPVSAQTQQVLNMHALNMGNETKHNSKL